MWLMLVGPLALAITFAYGAGSALAFFSKRPLKAWSKIVAGYFILGFSSALGHCVVFVLIPTAPRTSLVDLLIEAVKPIGVASIVFNPPGLIIFGLIVGIATVVIKRFAVH
jgi:hypothetical protein